MPYGRRFNPSQHRAAPHRVPTIGSREHGETEGYKKPATLMGGASGSSCPVSEFSICRNRSHSEAIDATQQKIKRAIHERDFSVLERFWSAQMVVNAPENTIRTREDVFADMRNGGLSYSSLKGTAESFHVFGDIAVEMGHEDFLMAAGPAAGKPLQRRYTNLWQRTGDHCVQIARQATILNADADRVYGSTTASAKPQPR